MLSQQLLMLLLPGACTDLPLQLKGLTGPLPSQSGACPPAGLLALPCPAHLLAPGLRVSSALWVPSLPSLCPDPQGTLLLHFGYQRLLPGIRAFTWTC